MFRLDDSPQWTPAEGCRCREGRHTRQHTASLLAKADADSRSDLVCCSTGAAELSTALPPGGLQRARVSQQSSPPHHAGAKASAEWRFSAERERRRIRESTIDELQAAASLSAASASLNCPCFDATNLPMTGLGEWYKNYTGIVQGFTKMVAAYWYKYTGIPPLSFVGALPERATASARARAGAQRNRLAWFRTSSDRARVSHSALG